MKEVVKEAARAYGEGLEALEEHKKINVYQMQPGAKCFSR